DRNTTEVDAPTAGQQWRGCDFCREASPSSTRHGQTGRQDRLRTRNQFLDRPSRLEEIFQQRRAFAFVDAAINVGPVMAGGRSKEAHAVFDGTALRVGSAEIEPSDACK